MLEKWFKLKKHNTTVKTEIIAGITTFLAMAYILALNPANMAMTGMDKAAVFTATALASGISTICMAFMANYPIALSTGVSLSAFFAFTVCGSMGYSYQVALTAVFVEGFVFILLSFFKFREKLVDQIPTNLKFAISAGIGLFLTIIALQGSKIVVSDPSTCITLGSFSSPEFVLAIVGLLIIGMLSHYNVKGNIIIGILATWILGIGAELIGWYKGVSLIPNFSTSSFAAPRMFQFDFNFVVNNLSGFAFVVFTFLYSDIFDTVGTLIGVANKGNLLDKDGKLPRVGNALMADAIGTVTGACLGTPTVTSYIESTSGVAAGGRTGLTALTTGVLFLASLVLAPLFIAIPSFATAPAMLYVGLLMLASAKNIDFESDIADSIGSFLAIVMMPFTYTISYGIMFGVISWVVLKVLTGKYKDVKPVMWVSVVLFALYIAMKIVG